MSSHELSRETHSRRRAVRGGTTICSRCDQPRCAGSAYCRDHRNEYQRAWRADLALEIERLRAISKGQSNGG
jgi:hypothetical protein